jgi:hypothetical protein
LQSGTSKQLKEQQTARTHVSCTLYVTKNEMVIKEQEVLRTDGFQNMLWKGGSSIYIENKVLGKIGVQEHLLETYTPLFALSGMTPS